MTVWRGIESHVTDVDSTPGASPWQANTRMRKAEELQRRWGFLSTAIAQQAGPIRYIIGAYGLGSNYLTLGNGGEAQGFVGDGGGGSDPWPPVPKRPRVIRPDGLPEPPCDVYPTWTVEEETGGSFTSTVGTLRYDFVDSENCGGPGAGTQTGSACTLVSTGPAARVVTASGMIEAHSAGYDSITVYVNGVQVIFMESEELLLGCTMVPRSDSYEIPAGTIAEIRVVVSTVDEDYHQSAYWEVTYV